jgi:hypothetical protein
MNDFCLLLDRSAWIWDTLSRGVVLRSDYLAGLRALKLTLSKQGGSK